MAGNQTCRRCGARFSGPAPGRYCPSCLIREGLGEEEQGAGSREQGAESREQKSEVRDQRPEDGGPKTEDRGQKAEDPSSLATRPSPLAVRFGDYELLEEIGQGGMGVVWKARQVSLNRTVAVKMIRAGPYASREFVHRFRMEASAAAVLQHPNIVAVHEVGVHQGQHFFSMDYVAGQNLAQLVRDGPVPAERAARYVQKMAEAIQHAHDSGILHRDLKPSNVIIDAHDEPRLTDFGLAKQLHGDSTVTLTGEVIGTPAYMPPEQASGNRGAVNAWSDIYSLGAILYHLLTGRAPFAAASLEETIQQVLQRDPVSVRLLNPAVPRDLETVCLKCLEKEPSKRYATAQLLADELGRYLKNEPILARPISRAGRIWRWCRRNPRVATATGAAFLSLVIGLAGTTWGWRRAKVNELLARQNVYAADMKLAQLALLDNNVGFAVTMLEKHRPGGKSEIRNPKSESDLRGWEWRYLWQLSQGDESFRLHRYPDAVGAVAVSKDGRLLAVQTGGNKAALWDLTTRRPITEFADAGLKALAFSPDDRLLAVASRDARGEPTVDLWDLGARKLRCALTHAAPVRSLAFSPDGKLLATFDDKGTVEVVEWRSNRILTNFATPSPRRSEAGVVTFSPDGNRLAVGEDHGTIRVLRWPSGRAVPIQTQTSDGVIALAFSPDSKLLAASFGFSSGTIRLWNSDSGEPRGQLTNHTWFVNALAFSPDGQRLASASADGTIRIWNVAVRTEPRRLQGHQDEVQALAFVPDGRTLVSGCKDGSVYSWDSAAGSRALGPNKIVISSDSVTHAPPVVNRFGTAFTPDGRSFITTERDGTLGIWDAHSVQLMERLPALGTNNWAVALSPDGHWLAAGDTAKQIHIWDWRTRRRVIGLDVPFEWCGHLRFSRSGRFLTARVFFNDDTARMKIWQTAGWGEVPLAPDLQAAIMSIDVAPDDRCLATGYADGRVTLWSFPAGQPKATFSHHKGWVFGVLFSGDGRVLASTGNDGTVRLWDVAAQRELVTLRGHIGSAWGAAFSPDGRRLATGGGDTKGGQARDAVKLWDLATHRELLTLPGEGQFFTDLAFSPDGNTVVATPLSGIAHFWRAPSWEEIEAAEKRSMAP